MYTTVEQVKELSGYDVTEDKIYQAQAIVEAFSGRYECDVKLAKDREVLGKSTAYQAAYMVENYETIFQQVAITSLAAPDMTMTFDITLGSPYLAPLAVITLRGLSDRGPKTVKIGSVFGVPRQTDWSRD